MTWRIAVDTGGTFTDCLATAPDGALHRAKVLTSSVLRGRVIGIDPLRVAPSWSAVPAVLAGLRFGRLGRGDEARVVGFEADRLVLDRAVGGLAAGQPFELRSDEPAPILAARVVTATPHGAPLPPIQLRLATTLATNALLEGQGAAVTLFVTRGFADLLEIGTQQRPDLFALDIRKPRPLAATVVEVDERLAADGSVVSPLRLDSLPASGRGAAAVALLHSWRSPAHERAVSERLRAAGFDPVIASHELSALQRYLPRTATAVIEAALAPLLAGYLERIAQLLRGATFHVMTSAGGLHAARGFRARDSLLSGPAGGVAGAAAAAARSGIERAIAFDMGGTSTDVARIDAALGPDYAFHIALGEAELLATALAIESVAAGGGSILGFDGDRLSVGPRSAGASPGPACYGAGGPLTVTDLNLLLGRLDADGFALPLAIEDARARLTELAARAGGEEEALLDGWLAIVNERMAQAIRRVSIRRGHDPSNHVLVAFGGAGGQHACAVAAELGMRRVLVPPDAGLLSARGVGAARLEHQAELQVLERWEAAAPRLDARLAELEGEARSALAAQGVAGDAMAIDRRILGLKLAGQDEPIAVELDPGEPPAASFARRYRELYGYDPEGALELDWLRVVAAERGRPEPPPAPPRAGRPAEPVGTTRARFAGRWVDTAVFDRARLRPGDALAGPALVREAHGGTVLEPGWRAQLDAAGALLLEQHERPAEPPARHAAARLELDSHRFESIALEMGERLRRTAVSTNIKERLDFSCAILDAEGGLVVNAPHIPVHLGSLGLCVRRLRESIEMAPGDAVVTNHPAWGGSHLPDVTVVSPVWLPSGRLAGYVASRAHHAELGGRTPGSMPPDARRLGEEGVVLAPLYLVRRGQRRLEELRARLLAPPWPSRAPAENLADLAAQLAANLSGVQALLALAADSGEERLLEAMAAIGAHAASRVRRALGRLAPGERVAIDALDDGTPVAVRITLAGDRAVFDFTGSGGVHPGNLNATEAIVRAAVLYALRVLVAEPMPLNDGLLRAIDLVLPPGLLAPPFPEDPSECPAIVGGNTETSQRVADVLLLALGLAAASQGTMNNVLFGDGRRGYYETVAGGAGAGPGFAGASAVHTHMTNTRITDPEILEHRHPVRLRRFAVRRGSGGAGRFAGGDGVVREIEFLAPLTLSLLTQRRKRAPPGLAGGAPGQPGRNTLRRASGSLVELEPVCGAEVGPGDRLLLETPGGGGYGRR